MLDLKTLKVITIPPHLKAIDKEKKQGIEQGIEQVVGGLLAFGKARYIKLTNANVKQYS